MLGRRIGSWILERELGRARVLDYLEADGQWFLVLDFGIARADTAPGLTASGATIGGRRSGSFATARLGNFPPRSV